VEPALAETSSGELAVPRVVIAELTNACNLRCPLCTTYLSMQRPRGFMELSLFESVLAELAEAGLRPAISMNMCGEPLLHPEAGRFVEAASSGGFQTFISTNATTLDERLGEQLVASGLDSIALCVDGATAEAHEAYRVGSRFDSVRENCRRFLEVRRVRRSPTPRVSIQSLLTAFSEGQIEDVLAWAWQIGADEVYLKSLSLGSHTTDRQREQHAHLLPQQDFLRRRPGDVAGACRAPLEQCLLYWDGRLGICCIDYNNMAALPTIRGRGFLATLKSPEVESARRTGCRLGHAVCARCLSVRGNGFRGLRIDLRGRRSDPFAIGTCPDWREILHPLVSEAREHASG